MRLDSRDAAYLWDMLEASLNVVEFVHGKTFADYKKDRLLQSAVERQIEILGEAANKVSKEFCSLHSEIPWRQIIGQRNILAHEYKDVAAKLIWQVAVSHVPALIKVLRPLIPEFKEK